MKLTLEVLFNDPNVVKAVIDRSVATQQDEIFWKRYLDFEETKSRVFKTYLGTVTGVTAGSVIDRNSNKPLRERKSLGSGYGEVAYLGDRYQMDNDRLDMIKSLIDKFNSARSADQASAMNAIIDYIVDGVPFDGGKAENYPLLLGSGMFIDGFEEQVAGIRPEEEREIHVTFPQQYTPELAGKAAVFRVKAHRIVRRSMPELNDEFARAQGFSDAAALRQAIMSAALQRKEAQARDAYADALVRQVLDGMEVRVPDSMVESQLTGLLQELENRLMSQGASLSDYLQMAGMTEEDLRAHARENALESARYELAMTEIARLEHICVTDEDVERRYQEMSRQFGVPVEHIRQQLPPMQLSHDLKLAYARAVVVDSGVRL